MVNAKFGPMASGLLVAIKKWLDDPAVSEILLNRPQQIVIEKNHRMSVHSIPEYDEITLNRLFQLIANENQQQLNAQHPMLSGCLADGSRVQLIIPPVTRCPIFSIRRKVVRHRSLKQYQQANYYQQCQQIDSLAIDKPLLSLAEKRLAQFYEQSAWSQFVEQAIFCRKNIVVSGATASGKTTFLNACLQQVDPDERLIILEDTREIETPHHNQVQLLATKGEQGLATVTMQDLLQATLRLRPDRIIMGEIRGKEILDFVHACTTGHSGCMTTIHANNPQIAFMRMMQLYKLNNVPAMRDEDILAELKTVIDIIIQLSHDQAGRRISAIYYRQT